MHRSQPKVPVIVVLVGRYSGWSTSPTKCSLRKQGIQSVSTVEGDMDGTTLGYGRLGEISAGPRRDLTLTERMKVLRKFEKIPSIRIVARLFQCGRTQIQNIVRNRKLYTALWSKSKNHNLIRTRRANSPFPKAIGLILFEWIQRARFYRIKLTDDILQDFGCEIAKFFKCKRFQPSTRWLDCFKQKYKLLDKDLNDMDGILIQPKDKKPLSIRAIIDDMRREHGHLKIPTLDSDGNSIIDEEYLNPLTMVKGYRGTDDDLNPMDYYDESSDRISSASDEKHTRSTGPDPIARTCQFAGLPNQLFITMFDADNTGSSREPVYCSILDNEGDNDDFKEGSLKTLDPNDYKEALEKIYVPLDS